jgi:hypothetical protein
MKFISPGGLFLKAECLFEAYEKIGYYFNAPGCCFAGSRLHFYSRPAENTKDNKDESAAARRIPYADAGQQLAKMVARNSAIYIS